MDDYTIRRPDGDPLTRGVTKADFTEQRANGGPHLGKVGALPVLIAISLSCSCSLGGGYFECSEDVLNVGHELSICS